MPTETYPPRCPHRVASTRHHYRQTLLLVGLLLSTTATVSRGDQEMLLLDYRFVVPAGHMQPWPDVEPEISITPQSPTAGKQVRIATKWRTNLTAPRKNKKSAEEQKISGQSLKDAKRNVELLVVPKAITDIQIEERKQPARPTRDCYQAGPLSTLSTSITLSAGKLPTSAAAQCAAQTTPAGDLRLVGAWAGSEHHWSATCSRHRPLYFEEINAERYGYTVSYALQPAISAAHFFATIPALPYKMAVDRPRDCIYTLGHYRPGSCVPRRASHLPVNLTASAVESGLVAGLILLVP